MMYKWNENKALPVDNFDFDADMNRLSGISQQISNQDNESFKHLCGN